MILVDDMINTGATLILAARTLHEKGAKSVHAVISHGMSQLSVLVLHLPLTYHYIRASFGGRYELNRWTTYHRVGGMYFTCMGFRRPN